MNFWKKYDRLIVYYFFIFIIYINKLLLFFLQWEYHSNCLNSYDIINFYGFTEDPNTSKYMVVMDYANW